MAKKIKDMKIDSQFDLDHGLDDFNFDMPDPSLKDDRKPVVKVLGGIKEGAKSTASQARFIKEALKNILPAGYGKSIDETDRVTQTVKNLYDESVRDVRPIIKQAKQAAVKLIPSDSKLVPKALKSVLDKWAEDNKDFTVKTNDAREALLSSNLNELFAAQINQQQQDRALAEGKEALKDGVALIRHRSVLETLNRTALSVSSLDQYNTKINIGYQRKSLELQYRLLYAAQDQLTYFKEDAVKRDKLLLDVIKNTALPEYVKIRESEARNQAIKHKFYDALASGLYGSRHQYLEKTISNLTKKAGDSIKGGLAGVKSGLSQATLMAEMARTAEHVDPYVLGGNVAGGGLASMAGYFASKYLGGKLKNSKLDKRFGVTDKSSQLLSFWDSLPNRVNEFAKSGKYTWASGPKAAIMRAIQGLVPSMKIDTQAVVGKSGDMNSPYHFTKRTDRSINEIIPGYLARILREIQIGRTGNEKTPLISFDHDRNRFVTQDRLNTSLRKAAAPAANVQATQRRLSGIMTMVDPNNELNETERAALQKHLLFNSADRNLPTAERLAAASQYKGVDAATAEKLSQHMGRFLTTASSGHKQIFESAHNALADDVGDPRAHIQTQIDAGNLDAMRQLGLVNGRTNKINLSKILGMYLQAKNGRTLDGGPSPDLSAPLNDGPQGPFVGPQPNAGWYARQASGDLRDRALNAVHGVLQTPAGQLVHQAANAVTSGVAAHVAQAQAGVEPSLTSAIRSDLFLTGETLPRIQSKLVALNQYRLKLSGKVVLFYRDLVDDVVDAQGQLVVSAAEIPKLSFYDVKTKTWKTLQSVLGTLAATASKAAQQAKQGSGAVAQAAQNFMKEMLPSMPDEPVDLYVEGEDTPRVTMAQMKAGALYDDETKEPILKPSDLNGDVKDARGQTVISREEIPRLRWFNYRIAKYSPLWFAGKLAKKLWDFQTKTAPKMAARNLKRLWSVYKTGAQLIWNVGKTVLGIRKGPQDVYLRGETTPVLYGKFFAQGKYFSQKNPTKALTKPEDISGAVVNDEGRVVLTDDEISNGLFYINGRKVKTSLLSKIIRAVIRAPFALTGMTVRGAGRLAAGTVRQAGRAVGAVGSAVGRGVGSAISTVGGGLWSATKYGLGVRYEGSREERAELERLRRGGQPKDDKDPAEDKVKNLNPDSLAGKLKGSFGTLKKRFGLSRQEVEELKAEEDTEDIAKNAREEAAERRANKVRPNSWLDKINKRKSAGGVGAAATTAASAPKGAADPSNAGGLGELLSKAKDLLSGGKTAAKVAGKGAGALWKGARALLGLGGAAEAVSAAGGVVGAGEAAAGAGAAAAAGGTTLGGMAAAAGGSVLAFLTSPVVLGVGAAALAGYGAYRAVKYLRRGHLSAIGQLRMVQYGFKADDAGHAKQVVDLEQVVLPRVKLDNAGLPTIDEKGLSDEERMKPFDLNRYNRSDTERFHQWYQKRFKPVFLTHLAAAKAITGKLSLDDVDDLKAEKKKRYLDAVAFSSGPYAVQELPVPQDSAPPPTTAQEVVVALQAALKDLTAVSPAVKAATATAGLLMSSAQAAQKTPGVPSVAGKPFIGETVDSTGKALMGATATIGLNAMSDGSAIGALEAVRFKAYGLTSLVPEKVASLRALEKVLEGQCLFGRTGSASWNGDANDVLRQVSNVFGVSAQTSPRATAWLVWFNKRFLPTYLVWLTAYRARTGRLKPSEAASAIKPADQYEIAKLIVGTRGIWSVTASPWDNVAVAVDEAIVKDNLNFLQDLATKKVVQEQKKAAEPVKTPPAPSSPVTAIGVAAQTASKPTVGQTAKTDQSVSSPDAEAPVSDSSAGGASQPTGRVGSLVMASGPLADGRNAGAFLRLDKDVTLDGMNPQMKTQLLGMIEEYGTLTGKSATVRSGYRTFEQQAAEYQKDPSKAAKPGTSMHEFGLAVDLDRNTLNEMEKLGLMRKYGFTRPVGQEPWHMEPIGTQNNLALYKTDQGAAAKAIEAGIQHGGGGWALDASAGKTTRNLDLSTTIAQASVDPTDPKTLAQAAQRGLQLGGAPGGRAAIGFAARQPTQVAANDEKSVIPIDGGRATAGLAVRTNAAQGRLSLVRNRTPVGSNDAESAVLPGLPAGRPLSSDPADPTTKIPDPKGSGIDGLRDTILAAAKTVGVDGDMMLRMAAVESDFNPTARSSSSSAAGLYQFTDAAWAEVIGKYGKLYGYSLANTAPTDAKAAALMAAHYLKDNLQAVGRRTQRPVTSTDAYATHFLGPNGAGNFIAQMEANPNASGEAVFSRAAKANPDIFYEDGRALTLTEIYAKIAQRLAAKSKLYGIDAESTSVALSGKSPSSTTPAAQTTQAGGGSFAVAGFQPRPRLSPTPTTEAPGPSDASPIRPVRTAAVMRDPSVLGLPSAQSRLRPVAQPTTAGFTPEVMKTTEKLLSQQVDLLTEIRDDMKTLTNASSKPSSGAAEPAAKPPSDTPMYTPPAGLVDVKRRRYGGRD